MTIDVGAKSLQIDDVEKVDRVESHSHSSIVSWYVVVVVVDVFVVEWQTFVDEKLTPAKHVAQIELPSNEKRNIRQLSKRNEV